MTRLSMIAFLPRAARALLLLAAAVGFFCTLMTLAFAQTGAPVVSTVFDFGPLAGALLSFIAPTILSVGGVLGLWVFYRLAKFLGLKIDDRRRAALEQGLERAIGFAVSKLEDRAIGGIPIDLRSDAIKTAAGYAEKAVPGALKHFGKTSADLAEMVESRLEGLLIDPTVETADPLAPSRLRSVGAVAVG